ncbi:MAG: hypothetical protein IPI11_14745 [Haliscomenobacter sp.]|nr:hypothetical protein [Haliscomenobacter sp.]
MQFGLARQPACCPLRSCWRLQPPGKSRSFTFSIEGEIAPKYGLGNRQFVFAASLATPALVFYR